MVAPQTRPPAPTVVQQHAAPPKSILALMTANAVMPSSLVITGDLVANHAAELTVNIAGPALDGTHVDLYSYVGMRSNYYNPLPSDPLMMSAPGPITASPHVGNGAGQIQTTLQSTWSPPATQVRVLIPPGQTSAKVRLTRPRPGNVPAIGEIAPLGWSTWLGAYQTIPLGLPPASFTLTPTETNPSSVTGTWTVTLPIESPTGGRRFCWWDAYMGAIANDASTTGLNSLSLLDSAGATIYDGGNANCFRVPAGQTSRSGVFMIKVAGFNSGTESTLPMSLADGDDFQVPDVRVTVPLHLRRVQSVTCNRSAQHTTTCTGVITTPAGPGGFSIPALYMSRSMAPGPTGLVAHEYPANLPVMNFPPGSTTGTIAAFASSDMGTRPPAASFVGCDLSYQPIRGVAGIPPQLGTMTCTCTPNVTCNN